MDIIGLGFKINCDRNFLVVYLFNCVKFILSVSVGNVLVFNILYITVNVFV